MHTNYHMQHDAENYMQHHINEAIPQILLSLPFALALVMYIVCVAISVYCGKSWSPYHTASWIIGVFCAALAVVGPLASDAHMDFTVHMLSHLLLGMLAPLLIVLAAPVTIVLRTLSVTSARHLSRILRSRPVRIISNPITASLLNIGGLWILYTTNLYMVMQQNMFVHIVLHMHVFLAGYLFTVSIIYIDPTPHRTSFTYRAIVLVMALAGHSILSKHIYAHPPSGVPAAHAEKGAMLMYYGGDAIDLVLISIFCFQWFRAARPRTLIGNTHYTRKHQLD
ncbi:cytochrome c oxidase assembly protein [Ectobacillus funiculus]|uniref:cytochrome c oxidase assembly protein n=1 Tax=Ectobacillus funiculus TaxID=137993 RepID=UPI00101DB5A0|nr:cytochrome c oxidase assembly protein [Ectobacillus funiculus]